MATVGIKGIGLSYVRIRSGAYAVCSYAGMTHFRPSGRPSHFGNVPKQLNVSS